MVNCKYFNLANCVLINAQLALVLLLFVSNFSGTIEQHQFQNETVQRVKQQLSNEKRLIKDLVDNYQVKWGRPVNNMSEKVVVFFGINLVQLLDLVCVLEVQKIKTRTFSIKNSLFF